MIIKEYFPDSELICRCGCGAMPDPHAVELLYALRMVVGVPLYCTSGARCMAHHVSVGKSTTSFHVKGLAFDLKGPQDLIVYHALNLGFKGIGIDLQFTHIDLRPSLKFWRY